MKKDWLYWIGGASSKSSKRGRFTKEDNVIPPPPPPSGCMCFQIFDLNHFFPLVHHQQQSSKLDDDSGRLHDDIDHEQHTTFKGAEAPRNSLELQENLSSNEGVSSISSSMKEQANLNIRLGIQIRTSCDSKSPRESTSECSSPGTKTPGVVARLMGLDLLPEDGSLSSSRFSTPTTSMKSRLQHHYSAGNRNEEDRARNLLKNKSRSGTLSLPGTPRVSSSSDRRSDVDQSRLSLQITNKAGDNNGEDDQFDLANYMAKRLVARRREEHAKSSCQEVDSTSQKRHYAKQIVKQMKESVTRRKFGLDITNAVENRDEQNVVLLKPHKKSFRENNQSSNNASRQTTPSCSPKLRFLEIKNHHKSPPAPCYGPPLTESQTCLAKISLDNKIPQEIKHEVQLVQLPQSHQQPKAIHKVASERYKKTPPASGASIIRNKKEEPYSFSIQEQVQFKEI
ncbi:hypothetical protein Leryth_006873 [Lithospermum erythrorhizon]|nr:hypothetical protein Leryth_006873 [Lithospermum erythrorhizon]